jgi:DUF4097 and DUF4098 domain-containing protein YvlB
MRRETFETPGPLTLDIRIPAGEIELEAVDGTETEVELSATSELEEEARIELRPRRDGHELSVVLEKRSGFFSGLRGEEVRLRVTTPPGANVEVSTASADTEGHGVFGNVDVNTASGDVSFDKATGDVAINSASGDLKMEEILGGLTVNTASGDVELGRLGGEGKIRSASGDVQLEEAEASIKVQTASGDVEIESVREGDVVLQTASGDIEVGIKKGSKLWIDAKSMSGETTSDLDIGDAPPDGDGPMVEVRATAMSGDITVKRA